IGHTLTGLFETAFQVIPGIGALPAEFAYQQNGLMFGNRLIRETGNVVFQDPAFRTDLINFIHNCTSYDLIDGTLDPAAFSTSDDVWPLMASPNPARFSTLTSAGGSVGVDTCPNVYQSLNGRLPAQITRIEGRLAFQLNPTLPGAAAAAAIAGQIQQAYLKNSIATAAATAADLIRQNAMLNAIEDTSKIVGQKVNDPAAMVLAVGRAQAVAQQNATWLNYGKVAEQALPVFRNVVEAVTYAMFPLFVLLLLLTSGRETMIAFKGYAAVLIWIQLWPPLYAILNYMASIYAAYDLAAAADLGTGTKALALQTASTIYSRAISGEAVVGYLAISIPFIAWAALKRMENFGTALVGGLSGLQAMIAGGTSASTVGNVSMGNVGMDQMQLAPNRTSAFMSSWQNDLSGNTFSSNALTGRTAVSLLRNQGFASRMVSMRVSEQDVVQASRQADAARGEAISANTERSAALTETFTRGLARLRFLRSSSGTVSSSFEQMGETLNRLDQISKNVADSTGLTQSQVAQIAFGAAGHLGINTPVAGAELQARAGKNYMSGLSAAQQKVLNSLTQEQIAEFKQFGDRVSRDSSLINSLAKDSREAQDMSSRLASAVSRAERADATFAERTALAERLSLARDRGESLSIDIAQDPHNLEMFLRYAEQYGGDSASALSMFEAELARQGLRPNRVFSDGTALPTSFDDVRVLHDRHASDPTLSPDLSASDQQHRATVARSNRPTPSAHSDTSPPSLRNDVQTEGKAIRNETASARSTFDRKAEIVDTADGTLATKKSLLKQSGKQVVDDGAASIDNAKEVVKDLLRKEE
ncbi:conjugal transfer protein TraG N-terminal domain-containing protein, partial [Methyloversatilis discipulorum]|uniref:conjugal transfer protein TraG N-terminal domain-containing protein n=1 Tax=Methyloversatilis discipulorum TaxID=1119528 RepID=UPI003AF71EF4